MSEQTQDSRIHQFLDFWFGDFGRADLPSSDRAMLWFGERDELKKNMVEQFKFLFDAVLNGELLSWSETPRGRLALIILLDQFPRYYFRKQPQAFLFDQCAQKLTAEGMEEHLDRQLTLIERVFFYMPMVHAEDVPLQEKALSLYQELVSLALPESIQIYQLFLAYSYAHYRLIKEYGRFPQRNQVLGRDSTEAEKAFLKTI